MVKGYALHEFNLQFQDNFRKLLSKKTTKNNPIPTRDIFQPKPGLFALFFP